MTRTHTASRRRSYRRRSIDMRTRPTSGNAALCPRCGGVGKVERDGVMVVCGKCGGTGRKRE